MVCGRRLTTRHREAMSSSDTFKGPVLCGEVLELIIQRESMDLEAFLAPPWLLLAKKKNLINRIFCLQLK